ncbi:MAG: MurR/RpiR family transcriptional regulator [Clostridiales bacterium]|nr:MurR/RpiR family transcriptional regulator [Clostridiales bacterium]
MDCVINVFQKMNELLPRMSKGQKKIADFLSLNYEQAAFMTAARLGEVVGVSESTVVRFSSLLGFEGYSQFLEALAALVSEKLQSVNRIEVTNPLLDKQEVLDFVLSADADKIISTRNSIDRDAFHMAVDIINGAKNVYIVGIRSCAPLAAFLGFYLNLIRPNVHILSSNNSSEIFEQMLRVCNDDCVIGISFPRYSMRTLKALEYANNKSAKVIAITDSKHSPMNLYSSCNLFARSDMASIVDSLVAPLSVINALIVSLCINNQKDVIANMEELEDVWNEYQVYTGDEINMVDNKKIKINDVGHTKGI